MTYATSPPPNSSPSSPSSKGRIQEIQAELARRTAALRSRSPERPDHPTAFLPWTEYACRMRGSPYAVPTFYRDIYASTAPRLFIRKAAQTFASQYLVHIALWCCATQAGQRGNSLYVFPAERQGGDFCRARIEPVIHESPLLADLMGSTDNTFMKAIGKGFLYLRGGQTDKGLITVDVDLACLDEVARYPAGTLEMIGPRLSSSYLGWQRAASTPVFPSDQAGQLWERSTRRHYQVRCSHCNQWQQLEVDGNLNPETSQVECGHCRGDMSLDRLSAGFWEAEHAGGDWEGYQVNKLLSHRVDLPALAATYRQVLRGDVSQAGLQQFWNQDVGRSYLPKGGHLDADLLDACCSDSTYTALPSTGHDCVMGVDIGAVLHVVILEPRGGLFYLVHAATVPTFKDLGPLFYRYNVRRAVIDALPETHAARAFVADRALHGRAWLATYVEQQAANKASLCKWSDDSRTVQVNRTMAMDSVIHAMTTRRVVLPYPALLARELGGGVNQAGLGVFYRHLCAPVRVMALDAKGNQVARYDENGPDHLAHAALYAFVAAEQATGAMGVPAPTERPADPDDRYGEMGALDAFYAQDEFARHDRVQYSRGAAPHGGFRTGSGRVIPPTPDTMRAEQDYSLPAPIGPRQPAPDDLPPLDFSHAFDDG